MNKTQIVMRLLIHFEVLILQRDAAHDDHDDTLQPSPYRRCLNVKLFSSKRYLRGYQYMVNNFYSDMSGVQKLLVQKYMGVTELFRE